MRKPGRVCVALAKKMQENFPELHYKDFDREWSIKLTWLPENFFPARGYYRTDYRADCARWEAAAVVIREDGSRYTHSVVQGYTRMSDLIKKGDLVWHSDGEITLEPLTESTE